MTNKSSPEIISERLKSQFAPTYLTLTSIIQGVAISALVAKVEANYPQMGPVDWLLTITSFIGFLVLWHEYMMQSLAFVWIPTLLDSLVPFAFLAAELFLAHSIYNNFRSWLLGFSLVFFVGLVARITASWQEQKWQEENREIVDRVRVYTKLRVVIVSVIAIFFFFCWALFEPLHLERFQIEIAAAALAATVIYAASILPYWGQVLRYARGELKA
jgi:hypothetical protein